MLRIIRGRTLIVSTIASVVISAPAFALLDNVTESEAELVEAGDEAGEEAGDAWEFGHAGELPYAFDPTDGTLIIDLTDPEDDDADDAEEGAEEADAATEEGTAAPDNLCFSVAGGDTESADAEAPAETAPAEGCVHVNVTGPSGKINHGSVVSSVVHALKPYKHGTADGLDTELAALDGSFEGLDGPFGQYVRWFAQSDLGKNGDTDAELDLDGAEAGAASVQTDDDNGEKAKGKGKKDKNGENGGGAPAHSKGKGKNK